MQRPVHVIGEEVGHIDQSRNRTQAYGFQPGLQPLGARPVFHAADHAAHEHFTAILAGVIGNRHFDRAVKRAVNLHVARGLHAAQSARGQITRDPTHAQRIGAVRSDSDLDHRIHLGRIIGRQPIDEPIAHLA